MHRKLILALCTLAGLAGSSGTGRAQQAATALPGADASADEWYMVTPDTVSIYVRELGRGGDTVIVLHGGWGVEHQYLLPAISGLENRAHYVFYDQRGSLRSPVAPSKISVQKHVEDLDQLRRALGLERVTLFAHSMGTYLAMAYLQAHPDHVKGLILAGAVQPKSDSGMADANNYGQQMMQRPEVQAELHKQGLDRPNLSDRDATHAWRIQFAGVNLYHIDRWRLMQGGGRAFYNGVSGSAAGRTMPKTRDFMAALRANACPIHVIVGSHDYVDWRARHWTEAAKSLPNLHLHVLQDAGHSSWIDQPEQFRAALAEGLDQSAKCSSR